MTSTPDSLPFLPPTHVPIGDLSCGERINHNGAVFTIAGYHLPSADESFVLLESDSGEGCELEDSALVEPEGVA